jgi:hypothetical protein
MINPFSPKAMSLYLERFSKAFDAAKPALPRAQYHDSFEYEANWPPELLDVFRTRRGYDLADRLPEMFNPATDADTRARIKYDYRLTLAELHRDTLQLWVDWAHARGMITRNQAHGSPANLLDIYAQADLPETEMFGAPNYPIPGFRLDEAMAREGDANPQVIMMAASAAHVAHAPGRQLVSAESCTWLREHWHTTLGQMKLAVDGFFLAGANHVFYHGTCYSPVDAPWPGWYFYAATKVDWRNSIWRDLPQLNAYIARCQSILQAGEAANDILLYWPVHDLWNTPEGMDVRFAVHKPTWMSESRTGVLGQDLMRAGYTLDFVSDALLAGIDFRDGRLQGAGSAYRAIVVPKCTYMPPETMAKLADLAEQGAKILFDQALPTDVPGLADLENRRAGFAEARTRLEKSAHVAPNVATALDEAGIAREPMADAGLQFVRRQANGAHYYFIANHSANNFDGWLPLALHGTPATLLDPMTAESGRLATRDKDGAQQVYLQLDAGASAIIELGGATPPAWTYLKPAGEAIAIDGPWALDFVDGGPELPQSRTLDRLASWTDADDAQAFAGTGKYTARFILPESNAAEWVLDLGDVRESARVRINGKDAGTLVALPFRMRVGNCVKPGENAIEIEVTNLTVNRIRAHTQKSRDWMIMNDINIVTVNYTEFKPEEWPLVDSGLLGPVRLIPMSLMTP